MEKLFGTVGRNEAQSFLMAAQLKGARFVDLGLASLQAVIWTELNPLTDSTVVLEVLFDWNAEYAFAKVTSQFRDHEGEGDMIPHEISQGFDGKDVLSAAECYYRFHEYMGNQKIEHANRVALNNERVMNENPARPAETEAMYEHLLCKKVKKTSNKPFKSGGKVNTVFGFGAPNPVTGRMTFNFFDDESEVECFRCVEWSVK